MMILSQNKEVIVNTDNITGIVMEERSIKAYTIAGEHDNWILGRYKSKERCKEIIEDIFKKPGDSAMELNYEMPEE